MTESQGHLAIRKFAKELNSGTISLVLLTILARAGTALYGYEIAKQLEELPEDGLPIKRGTLYPVLRSMEEKGLLASRVEPSVSGPPRKYYSITEVGKEALENWTALWRRTVKFVDATLEGGN